MRNECELLLLFLSFHDMLVDFDIVTTNQSHTKPSSHPSDQPGDDNKGTSHYFLFYYKLLVQYCHYQFIMFSMGRFDPRLEDAKSVEKVKEKKKAKRTRKKKQKRPGGPEKNQNNINEDIKDRLGDSIQVAEEPTEPQENAYESDGSSSVPSSEGSSSSAPSSDDESSDQEDEAALKVIAPEQKFVGVETKRRRLNITNEGIDDFDQETIENVDNTTKKNDEVETALKISKMATHDAAKLWKLAPFLIKNLEEDGYDSFFPIQALVIPDVIASETHAHIRNRDVCVAAPTGSGKTLAFVLPVLNSLASRRIKRLRALVVLPSRDLGA